jgi:hypothetical protein
MTALAIWGAVTGTIGTITGLISLFLVLASKRPRFRLTRYWQPSPQVLALVIDNPSQSALMVSRVWPLRSGYTIWANLTSNQGEDSVQHAAKLMAGQNVPLYLMPGESGHFGVRIGTDARPTIVVAWWHRNWRFLRLPYIFSISQRIAEDINNAAS